MAQARSPSDLPPRKSAEPVVVAPRKETSPELASLAASYLRLTHDEFRNMLGDPSLADQIESEVRALAASVLSQTEPQP